MIYTLRGKLVRKSGNEIILDVGGVGYGLLISASASKVVSETGNEYTVVTYLDVKENSMQLYGFADEREREIFKLLLTVSGIGPKNAHNILSSLSFEEIISMITGRAGMNSVKIPGIGAKKLELISMTLRDRIYKIQSDSKFVPVTAAGSGSAEFRRFEALNALMNLGYQRTEGERIIREVIRQSDESDLSTEEIIRKSLEYISK